MSQFYRICTLSDENIERLLVSPDLFNFFFEREDYIEERIRNMFNSKGRIFKKCSTNKILKKLGLFQIGLNSIDLPSIDLSSSENKIICNQSGEEWNLSYVLFLSHFMEKSCVGGFYGVMGAGKFIDEYEANVYTTSDIKRGIQDYIFEDICVTDEDLNDLYDKGIITSESSKIYYRENREETALWIKSGIIHLLGELQKCLDLKVCSSRDSKLV